MPKNDQSESHKCQGMLSTTWNGICDRKGKLEYQGKWYCATHFPPNVKARSEERQEKYKREWEEHERKLYASQFERNLKNMVFDHVLRNHPEWVYQFAQADLNLVSNSDELIEQWIELAKQRKEKEEKEKREGLPYEPEA